MADSNWVDDIGPRTHSSSPLALTSMQSMHSHNVRDEKLDGRGHIFRGYFSILETKNEGLNLWCAPQNISE